MISSAAIEDCGDESLLNLGLDSEEENNSRFEDLRGVQWRINLGILPSKGTTDELRRVTANARRRYAGFRRRLLVDPHIFKDGSASPDLVMDNPLSQNPDSMWGQFFRNAELEKMLDQDLSRLYPEDGSYFQTPASQGILRRILLLWCLRHPEYGYRQGMHELLAPLLYVLHVDVQYLAEVRKVYDHHFNDRFDDMSFPQSDLVCNYKSLKLAKEAEDANSLQGHSAKSQNPDELDPKIKAIVLLTDAYGAEGELGILLSERFMEHDAYCMFDALMTGACGAVAMAEYYSISPSIGSHTGLPAVIEASSALYHLLSFVDSSLHSHLIELGVEPQYFALRWLRVLYGREFVLEDLLTIWDEIFASGNDKPSLSSENEESSFAILQSPRGAFIAAMAVSMLLQLRSSLLSTETATSCLQRLLNFPENVDVKKLIEKAKSLQSLALDTRVCLPAPIPSKSFDRSKSSAVHSHSLSSGSISPRTPLSLVPESYWEEKWRVLHNEEAQQGITTKYSPSGKQRLTEKNGLSLGLGRTESDPSHLKLKGRKKQSSVTVRRSLLDDLSRALGEDEGLSDSKNDPFSTEGQIEEETSISRDFHPMEGETSQSGHIDSEENSFVFSASSSPLSTRGNDNDNNNDSGRSSVASNSSTDQSDAEPDSSEERNREVINSDPPLPDSEPVMRNSEVINDDPPLPDSEPVIRTSGKPPLARKPLSGRFQWLWKLGKNANDVPVPSCNDQNDVPTPTPTTGEEPKEKNVIGSLKNLGHSMLENIQVIETVIQQERNHSMENLSKNALVGKGQVTAVAALKELRKISNLLSEM